jgi:tetratricopeptide (TPR) repeat protein
MECIERPREEREWIGCSDFFRAAVASDPRFALAHYQLAFLGSTINVSGSAGPNRELIENELSSALEEEARLPARERSLVLALKAHVDGDDVGALRRYDDLIRRYPDDKHALYLAGSLLYDRSDYAAAVPYLQKATDLDPFFENAVRSLVHALGKLQRTDELRTLLDRWSRLPQNSALRAAVVRGAVWLGDLDQALDEAQKNARGAMDPSPLVDLAAVQFARGEFAASETTLRRAALEFPQHTRAQLFVQFAVAAQGRRREALQSLDSFYRSTPSLPDWEHRVDRTRFLFPSNPSEMWTEAQQLILVDRDIAGTFASAFALVGDVAHARELATLARPRTPDSEIAGAILAWREGDAPGAMARLKALDAIEPDPVWGLPPSFCLAEIASATGEDPSVLAAARRFRSVWTQLGVFGGWMMPRMILLEARSLSRLGRTDEARALVDHLLKQEAKADTNDPIARELRELKARLDLTPRR